MAKDKSVAFKQSTLLPQIEIRIADRSNACYDAHSHDEFSFGIIESGVAQYTNLASKHQIGRGDIVTINPADVHSCNPKQGDWSYKMLFVDSLWMGDIQQQVLNSEQYDYFSFSHHLERNRALQSRFVELYSSLVDGHSALEAETHLYEFVRACFKQDNNRAPRAVSLPYVQRAKEKLLDNVGDNLSLAELAQEAGVSQYHLIRSFKQYYGLSPHAYLLDERIKRAKTMLKTGKTIVDTSSLLGFSDQAHFQRNFKKRTAITPRAYQSFFC
ncbi:AraC family transcriptional regulator [Vibrio sp. T187]|uniref:AraC family transcriptional regulator n=1 Tax=Vibrio TaxID=662 RepID=UPI0010C9CA17|nr:MULTISPECIES: AraC family transcriptional regulator [Vibrio]MBW3696962.1 AraC family transcriptional regulator [Vibrio sp. T187]